MTTDEKGIIMKHLSECIDDCNFALSFFEEKHGILFITRRINLKVMLPDEAYKDILSHVRREIEKVRSVYRLEFDKFKNTPYKFFDK